MSRVAHFDTPILTLDTRSNDLLLLQHNPLLRLRELIKAASISAQETLELLLRDVGVGEDAARDALLQREHDELRDVRLGEDAGGGLALLGGGLVLDGVGRAVASTMRC